jgi:uroporphyrinogen-III synthase
LKILLTRPEPGAAATAARLAGLGHSPILAPCLTVTRRPPKLPDHPAAIIITSLQAVPALPAAYHHIPVFCVGDATAGRLREVGFSAVTSAAGDAEDLRRLITARPIQGTYLLATGARQGATLARQLRAARIPVLRRVVYAATPVRALPAESLAALAAGQIGAALFYSAETAAAFARLAPPGTGTITALALSHAVAVPLHGLPWAAIRVAVRPTEADLLALI